MADPSSQRFGQEMDESGLSKNGDEQACCNLDCRGARFFLQRYNSVNSNSCFQLRIAASARSVRGADGRPGDFCSLPLRDDKLFLCIRRCFRSRPSGVNFIVSCGRTLCPAVLSPLWPLHPSLREFSPAEPEVRPRPPVCPNGLLAGCPPTAARQAGHCF